MSSRPASIQDFLEFLRASGVPEAQLPPFQKVAEQLLLVARSPDVMSITPEQANAWREALRARNPTEAQLVLIARGISAIQAFQRRMSTPVGTPLAAPPAPPSRPPPPGAPGSRPPLPRPTPASRSGSVLRQPPPPALSGAKKAAVIVGLALFVVGAVAYTYVASRKALLENRKDSEILSQRNAERKIGIFYPAYIFTVQPEVACQPAVLAQVNKAVVVSQESRVQAMSLLEDALTKDPRCIPAARVLTILASHMGGARSVERFKDRLVGPAEQDPTNAPAQLMAAYYTRQMGDGEGYRKYLDRAQALDPTLPLLANAWASYWDLFAQPRDFEKELVATREEVQRTSDIATVSNLAALYFKIGDYERAAEMCKRFAAAVPDDTDPGRIATCLSVALATQDAPAEAKSLESYWKHANQGACNHADLAGYLLKRTCRTDDALREANIAIEKGCRIPGSGHRRDALLRLKRYEDAAEPPPDGHYWDGVWGEKERDPIAYPDRDHRAQALGMLGRDDEARAILEPIAARDEYAQILLAMIDNHVLRSRIEALPTCQMRTERAERLAGAAGGYISYRLFDDAQKELDQAFALDPKSPAGWADKVYMLSLQGKLKEAAAAGEQAKAMGVDDPTLDGNLGYVYQQLDQCDKAIPLFKRKMLDSPWRVPNYTNLAKCLESVGRTDEAATVWIYVQGGKPRAFWWVYALIVVGAVGLYLGGKFALIKLLPARFGHLKFP